MKRTRSAVEYADLLSIRAEEIRAQWFEQHLDQADPEV